jgi:hypothetical protein
MFAMKFNKRLFGSLAAAVTLVVQCYSQVATPVAALATLPPCLIQYFSEGFGYSYSRLILYSSNQTCVEINSYYSGLPGNGTFAPQSPGTFSYTVDPQNSSHATIAYGDGSNPDQLYFYGTNSGIQTSSPITPLTTSSFTIYPQQADNGACNVSNRCQLAIGGTATLGFVVQSDGPRWVLLRAIGASLGNFGVSSTVSSPSFTLYDSTQATQGTSSVWSSDLNLVSGYQTIFSLVGAFPLSSGSDEGVLLVPLNPGAYTAQFKAGSAGAILFEAYILPF